MARRRSEQKRQAILDAAYGLFREKGFEKTSVAEINARVGGSKATIYSYFASKEELFVECMMAAAERYMAGTLAQLDASRASLGAVLREFGASYIDCLCSADMVAVRRLMIAEAAHSGTGKLFFDQVAARREPVAAFLSGCMASGMLHRDDPGLAADHLRALLEAEFLEPLMLQVRESLPDDAEKALAAERAVATFLRAYAPTSEAGRE